jgi:twitching motility protein PilI
MTAASKLRAFRDRPFELLREIERLTRAALSGQNAASGEGREWIGVGLRLGTESFLLAREETREVLSYPANLARVPGAKSWIRGLANVHGQLMPIVDLRNFLGGGLTANNRVARVLVANHREVPVGLMVDEVLGFKKFADGEFVGDVPPTLLRCERYLAGAFKRGAEVWPVFALRNLLESAEFLEAAAS